MNHLQRYRDFRRETIKNTGRRLMHMASHIIANQSLIGNKAVFEKSVFPWTENFEAEWQTIRNELDEVMKNGDQLPAFHELSPDQKRISVGNNWKTFVFYVFGDRFDPNCDRCPATARLLDALPNLRNAWFSILAPHYHIPPHQGPTKGIVRIHVGLVVPDDRERCWIRVDDQILHWEEGKCVVFDDFFEHEVRNDTDQQRAVLFFDVDRPMRTIGRLLNKALIAGIKNTAYVKDAKKNIQDWEYKHGLNQEPGSANY